MRYLAVGWNGIFLILGEIRIFSDNMPEIPYSFSSLAGAWNINLKSQILHSFSITSLFRGTIERRILSDWGYQQKPQSNPYLLGLECSHELTMQKRLNWGNPDFRSLFFRALPRNALLLERYNRYPAIRGINPIVIYYWHPPLEHARRVLPKSSESNITRLVQPSIIGPWPITLNMEKEMVRIGIHQVFRYLQSFFPLIKVLFHKCLQHTWGLVWESVS